MCTRHATGINSGDEYQSVLEHLYNLGQGRMLPGRDRLREVLNAAGNPHLQIPSVLVGGTNGKGSVVALLSVILSKQLTVGAFLKPHLKTVRERWRVNDKPISKTAFIEAANQSLEFIFESDQPVSFFEANVLLGALAFRNSGCDLVVWEVGLGGSEDACNLAEPEVSILTNVGLDHQQILGNTLEEIATDKAGIARSGRPMVLGPPRPGDQQTAYQIYEPVIRSECKKLGADYQPLPALPAEVSDQPRQSGIYPDTLAVVEHTLKILANKGLVEIPVDLTSALSGFHYRARLEECQLLGRPVFIDAAHNVDSMCWLARVLRQRYEGQLPVLFGCQDSRDPAELLEPIKGQISSLLPVEVPVLKPCTTKRIAESARGLGITVADCVHMTGQDKQPFQLGNNNESLPPDNSTGWIDSVMAGLNLARPARPLVICGSIYMIGEILRVFEDGWVNPDGSPRSH